MEEVVKEMSLANEPHPDYWKLKATELEFQLARQQLDALNTKRLKMMQDAGFDPNKNWMMNDNTQTITEQK